MLSATLSTNQFKNHIMCVDGAVDNENNLLAVTGTQNLSRYIDQKSFAVLLWKNNKQQKSFTGHKSCIKKVQFNQFKNPRFVLSVSNEGRIYMWSIESGECLAKYTMMGSECNAIWSPIENKAYASYNHTVSLFGFEGQILSEMYVIGTILGVNCDGTLLSSKPRMKSTHWTYSFDEFVAIFSVSRKEIISLYRSNIYINTSGGCWHPSNARRLLVFQTEKGHVVDIDPTYDFGYNKKYELSHPGCFDGSWSPSGELLATVSSADTWVWHLGFPEPVCLYVLSGVPNPVSHGWLGSGLIGVVHKHESHVCDVFSVPSVRDIRRAWARGFSFGRFSAPARSSLGRLVVFMETNPGLMHYAFKVILQFVSVVTTGV